MKVYACYHKVQRIEHWTILQDNLEFITQSLWKAIKWEENVDGFTDNGKIIHTRYYKEFDLQ